MARDIQHFNHKYQLQEREHRYGNRVHILKNPYLLSTLARLGRPGIKQPLINFYVQELYRHLLVEVVNYLFPRVEVSWETRMIEHNANGIFEGEVVDKTQPVIVVDLARAGTLPSHICYDELNYYLDPDGVRQDHYYLNRKTNRKGEVVGVDVAGSKIGGGQEGAIVLMPDPMGATGGSISHAISHYKENVEGRPTTYVGLHLVITPEYVRRMTLEHPDVEIFALRLDRGLSSEKVLNSIPGSYPNEEIGLNEKQYIVPGLGGMGEILNNSFI